MRSCIFGKHNNMLRYVYSNIVMFDLFFRKNLGRNYSNLMQIFEAWGPSLFLPTCKVCVVWVWILKIVMNKKLGPCYWKLGTVQETPYKRSKDLDAWTWKRTEFPFYISRIINKLKIEITYLQESLAKALHSITRGIT